MHVPCECIMVLMQQSRNSAYRFGIPKKKKKDNAVWLIHLLHTTHCQKMKITAANSPRVSRFVHHFVSTCCNSLPFGAIRKPTNRPIKLHFGITNRENAQCKRTPSGFELQHLHAANWAFYFCALQTDTTEKHPRNSTK